MDILMRKNGNKKYNVARLLHYYKASVNKKISGEHKMVIWRIDILTTYKKEFFCPKSELSYYL